MSEIKYKGNTNHANVRAKERRFTPEDVSQAIESAKVSKQVTMRVGKYGTMQAGYKGVSGLTVVMEAEGSNAGRLITAWWRTE